MVKGNKIALRNQPAAPSPPAKMTYEEFLSWADGPSFAEWVDGEVVALSPVNKIHQDILCFLVAVLRHFTEANRFGLVLAAPFQMKITRSGREPDLLFIDNYHLSRLKKTYLEGPADLAVEIVTPESQHRDRVEKFYEYEREGVPEYWVIDPEKRQAEFYVLGEGGKFHPAIVGDDGIYRSAVLKGLWIKIDWLWQEPLPPVMSILKEWGLV
ncbi:MAG: Uma2 family endonuclease [Planctomycetes bacterium]|nr:Uma2 family endonuclease [Planctomycetota bacterium]